MFSDDTAPLIHSLRKARLEEETLEHSSESPFEAHNDKNFPLVERRVEKGQGRVAASVYASPSNSNTTESLLRHESAKSSPDADRYKQIVESPSWRRGENFVRQSRDRSEDPFVTSSNTVLAPGRGKLCQIRTAKEANLIVAASPIAFRPRDDRIGLELSPDNAQAILPPNACVFVAKWVLAISADIMSDMGSLSHTRSDEELEVSVKTVFQTFGTVYVKIRRDNKGMPFAFCQYEVTLSSRYYASMSHSFRMPPTLNAQLFWAVVCQSTDVPAAQKLLRLTVRNCHLSTTPTPS